MSATQRGEPPYTPEPQYTPPHMNCCSMVHHHQVPANAHTMYYHNEPPRIYGNVVPLPLLQRHAALVQCPGCREVAATTTRHKNGKGTQYVLSSYPLQSVYALGDVMVWLTGIPNLVAGWECSSSSSQVSVSSSHTPWATSRTSSTDAQSAVAV